jgi:sulfatase maturation enzyme AslB (radical SAM superfamily)
MTRCLDPFKNINIKANRDSVEISPCCLIPTKPVKVIDFYNADYLQKIRQSWTEGAWPQECNVCRESEESFGTSRRIGVESWYSQNGIVDTTVDLIRLDYWVGDLCNLRCAICGPDSSSSWKSELGLRNTKQVVNRYWNNLDLTKLKFIHFNGGEPLLSKEHIEFIKAVPNKSQVRLNYNTNGTIRPSEELIELWTQFDLILLDFSIDDIEQRFEYQRYPAVWAEVMDNLQWFKGTMPVNCMFAVNTTISVLNQLTINQLDEWIQSNFYENRLGDRVEHRKQSAAGILSIDSNPENYIIYLDGCDTRRKTDWRSVFPELFQKLINTR